jgi:hypothetical protein
MTEKNPAPELPAYFDLLEKVHRAVADRLSQPDPGPARHHLATWGRTRVRKDGSVQIGRRDGEVLRRLAEGTGPIEDPKQAARTVAALQNVIAAHAEHFANPDGNPQNHRRARVLLRESTAAVGRAAGGGAILAAVFSIPPNSSNYNPALQLIDYVSTVEHTLAAALPGTPLQAAAAFGGAAVVAAVSETWMTNRDNEVLDHGVENAWAAAHGTAICESAGLAQRLPDLAGAFGDARQDAATASAAALIEQLSTGGRSDRSAVLTAMVQKAPVERAGVVADLIRKDNRLPELTGAARNRAIADVYSAISQTQTGRHPEEAMAAMTGRIVRASPGEQAGKPTMDPDQARAARAALGNVTPAGSAAIRLHPPAPANRTGSGQARTAETPNQRD